MSTGDMRVTILTEGAHTVAEATGIPANEFFLGTFDTIRAMEGLLSEIATVRVLIASDEYGFLRGSDVVENAEPSGGYDEGEVVGGFLQAVSDSDAVAVLLTAGTFTSLIAQNWGAIVDAARSESVWCLGASTTALSQVDTSQLQSKGCKVIEYERKGVAPIGSTARGEFLQAVEQRASED